MNHKSPRQKLRGSAENNQPQKTGAWTLLPWQHLNCFASLQSSGLFRIMKAPLKNCICRWISDVTGSFWLWSSTDRCGHVSPHQSTVNLFPWHTGPRFGRIHVNLHTNTWKIRVLIIQNMFLTGWAPPGMKQWRHTNVLRGLWAAGRSKLRLMPCSAESTDCVLLCFSGSKDSNIQSVSYGGN